MNITLLSLLLLVNGASDNLNPSMKSKGVIISEVEKCITIKDQQDRLACYDRATSSLIEAHKKGDVIILDKDRLETAQKQAFGLKLPDIKFFESLGSKSNTQLNQITLILSKARQGADGYWTLTMEDGQIWHQIEEESHFSDPKLGGQVTIKKGAVGNYFLKMDNQRAIRVERIQ